MIVESDHDIRLNLKAIRQHKRVIAFYMQQNKENPGEMEISQGFWQRMIVAENDLLSALRVLETMIQDW